ncbi:DUF4132 domain-containing protein [Kribbella sp. CA-293567]|uniref:DUF4132 domain-containing protein n=1 Tax=Kribbella sp. CA-293567 TaxID=3002436 RepID=UPI0022DE2FED|nr:DUF4132 domain-containing protein [Kribbella sp. CA-293567]WBQ08121.1 DUF4132 domain-containing protein [Kribbella sp. CA-293567]
MGEISGGITAELPPPDERIGRESVVEQATAASVKALPKSVEWLRWEKMPSVRWAGCDEVVPVEVLKWLVGQAVKAKSPEPGSQLRTYGALLDPADREAFGQYLLQAWLAEDLRSVDGEVVGSAVASKGLLALVAVCAREWVAPSVERYLKKWCGQRSAQARALIGMLAWVEHPGATQLMLSTGSRVRTKGIQDEVAKQAGALAERRGWSADELADRTIPTAGFDEFGVIELRFGDQVFSAVLRPDLTIELRSPDGQKIGALPVSKRSEDEKTVVAAMRFLNQAKKELQAIAQLQSERLYDALCTGRTWAADDWQRYFNEHPVLRHLVQRLAWIATTADGATVFRPLDDSTFVDVEGKDLMLPSDAVIAVAHDSLLDPATVEAWQEHLAARGIDPLFRQFGKGTYLLPEQLSGATEVKDFQGHLLQAFALRGRAAELGYTRGPTGAGGRFREYTKHFPTLGLTAVVGFSGNQLPERNQPVALTTLSFRQGDPDGPVLSARLSDLPAVLLSEVYHDLRLMAADGTGFDPDWQRKSDVAGS